MATAVPIPGRSGTPPPGSVGDSLLRKALSTSAGHGSPQRGSPLSTGGLRAGVTPGSAGSLASSAPRSASPLRSPEARSVAGSAPRAGQPSPAVYLHMQRRQLLRKMCTLILTYNRRHEFGVPVNVAMHRDYPKAISSARSLLSHLSPLEAAGAIKRVRACFRAATAWSRNSGRVNSFSR